MDAAIFPASGPVVTSNRILYTPSDFARSSLLNLQEIGTLEAGKAHENRRQGLASCLFFVVHSGSGFLTFEGEGDPRKDIIAALTAGGCAYYSVDVQRASLEDIFLELTDSEDEEYNDADDDLIEDEESSGSASSAKSGADPTSSEQEEINPDSEKSVNIEAKEEVEDSK